MFLCAEVEKGAKRGTVASMVEVGCRHNSEDLRRACAEKLLAEGVALEASSS